MSYGPNDGVGLPKRGVYRKPIRMQMASPTVDAASTNSQLISFVRTIPASASPFVDNTAQGYIQYLPNGVLGDKWEIKKAGIYSVFFRYGNIGANRSFGVLRNPLLQTAGGFDASTLITTTTESQYLYRKSYICSGFALTASYPSCSTTVYLNQGDFLMLCSNAGASSSYVEFIIEYVGQG